MNKGLSMEAFYPVRSADIPELVAFVQEAFVAEDKWGEERKENVISFLLPLGIDLLAEERSRAMKNTFLDDYGGNGDAKISDGFLKIVEAYLEENNGTGSLLRITEVLRSNGHYWIAKDLEKILLRYSLSVSQEGSENANIYSLSRECLHKEVIAGNSVSVWNANSVEKALQNSVILEEIFRKLRPKDQKLFRLVSPTWMEETVAFWRRNARILIQVSNEGEDIEPQHGISLPLFLKLWKNKKVLEEVANAEGNENQEMQAVENTENYKLQQLPFRSYEVSYTNCKTKKLFSCGKTETKFWELCGQFIEDLKIVYGSFDTKLCKRLLQDFCPNLKRLDLRGACWEEEEDNWNSTKRNKKDKLDQTEGMKIAENLHTLIFNDIDEDSLRSVLFMCPKLKTLALLDDEETTGALLSPVSNGEIIKLKKLDFNCFENFDFHCLRQYAEILAKKKFDCLEHLALILQLFSARAPPFNLHAALAFASNTLKSLKLELVLINGNDAEENSDWFMDLSPFTFPNLTKLNLSFDFDYENDDYDIMKFDFGTLKGMPMLEKLEISFKNYRKEVLRSPGAQDWVFDGDRNRFLPTGVTVDYQCSNEDPILCSKLKEFSFDGWSLNDEDIRLLSSWFPNLTHLRVDVNPGALLILLDNWPQLEEILIRTEKLISLGKLRPLKEKKKHIRIFQRISGMKYDESLELKKQNGWLYFSF